MSYQDLNVVVLYGKNPIIHNRCKSVSLKKEFTNSQNSASIERRIDDGKVTTPLKIPRDVSEILKIARVKNDATKTQSLLAMKCNLPVKDIIDIENGSMDLTHANKLKIRKVQQILSLPKFNL